MLTGLVLEGVTYAFTRDLGNLVAKVTMKKLCLETKRDGILEVGSEKLVYEYFGVIPALAKGKFQDDFRGVKETPDPPLWKPDWLRC